VTIEGFTVPRDCDVSGAVQCKVQLSIVYPQSVLTRSATVQAPVSHLPRRPVLAPDWSAAELAQYRTRQRGCKDDEEVPLRVVDLFQ